MTDSNEKHKISAGTKLTADKLHTPTMPGSTCRRPGGDYTRCHGFDSAAMKLDSGRQDKHDC